MWLILYKWPGTTKPVIACQPSVRVCIADLHSTWPVSVWLTGLAICKSASQQFILSRQVGNNLEVKTTGVIWPWNGHSLAPLWHRTSLLLSDVAELCSYSTELKNLIYLGLLVRWQSTTATERLPSHVLLYRWNRQRGTHPSPRARSGHPEGGPPAPFPHYLPSQKSHVNRGKER